jgi:hypothetical protein
MIIGSRELPLASWQKPAINTDAVQKDSLFNLAAPAQSSTPASAKTGTSNDTGSESKQSFDEAFAKMMVNLRMATSASPDTVNPAVLPPPIENQGSTDSISGEEKADADLTLSLYQDSPTTEKSATEKFMDFMNQTDAEKAREQLTGVSKEEYEKMSPEEQASLDKKVEELTKEKAKMEQQVVKAKIDMAKAEFA